jgi:hypothetical protein
LLLSGWVDSNRLRVACNPWRQSSTKKIVSRKYYVPNGIRDDTGLNIQLLGDAAEIMTTRSKFELHQVFVSAARDEETRYIGGCGEFADGHGDFVAGVAAGAVHAVFDHFVWQCAMLGGVEVEVFEEGGDAREQADALDVVGFSSIEESADEQATGSLSFGLRADRDGANLCQMLAVDMKSSAADELAGVSFHDREGVDVFADLGVTTRKQSAVVGEVVNELVDGAGVV